MKLYLIPRLNYDFSVRDLIISFLGIFRNNINTTQVSKLFKNNDIYFVNHARTGLRLLLNSFDLPQKAKIGLQILNCHTVSEAIIKAGFTPIFIDINETLTIALDDLKKKSDKIDALIVTHIFGIPAEIEKIKDIMQDKPVIEDCAHSFLSKRKEKLTGTFGDAAVFSFGKAKFPSIGNGGFVVINNKSIIPKFAKYLSLLEGYSFFNEIKNVIESLLFMIIHNRFMYRFITFPFVKRMSDKYISRKVVTSIERKALKSNLALLLYNINDYDIYKREQVENAFILKEYLKKYDFVKTVNIDHDLEPNFIMLPAITNNKDELIISFFKMGVEIGTHFSRSIDWAEALGYQKKDCRNGERLIPKLILFPTYKSITFN